VDPACGSGHFLTSVLEEIVNIRKALFARNDSYPDEYRLKKTTVLNNIYGVDIVGPAVEIAKLRCWLSVISELETDNVDDLADDDALALPNIAFNLREGNSLIGYTGFPETTDNGEYTLGSFSEDSVRDRYQNIIDEIRKHEQAIDGKTAEKHRRQAFKKLREAREGLIDDIHGDFVEAGIEDITPETVAEMEPFNWVLEFAEVYADGGFDVVVGNPPWDVIAPNREDYFSKYDRTFRTRGPSDKDKKQEKLLEDPSISRGWEEYKKRIETLATYFNESEDFVKQDPRIDGNAVGNENDLSMLFLERVFELARDDSYVSQVLPGTVFIGAAGKDLRNHLLKECSLKELVLFENKGLFSGLHNQYRFGVVNFKNSGTTDSLKTIFSRGNVDVLSDIDNHSVTVSGEVLERYSPKARTFPFIESQTQAELLAEIIEHTPLSEDTEGWKVTPYRELDRNQDRDRYVESKSEGDYPVYGGSNIHQFSYSPEFYQDLERPSLWSVKESKDPDLSAKRRIREKVLRSRNPELGLKKAIYNRFSGSGSQKSFVNNLLEEERGEPLSIDDVLLDCTEYRIVFRNITNFTNERTMICSVIPKGVVCHHALNTIRPYTFDISREDLSESPLHSVYERVFTDEELFVAVGLLNSLPFDYLMRTKIDENLVMYKLTESQVPRLTKGDEWFDYISTRASRLNCYGEEFEEMRDRLGGVEPATNTTERRKAQAEIDAAAFHAYGLDREQTAFVLDDFHRVQNPRVMDEDYFDMVLEKYDGLA
jgi:hypothetical protein